MTKITIIGLGLVGNSIGMALKRVARSQAPAQGAQQATQSLTVVGFDPIREREILAMRTYQSVDEVAQDLEGAVRDASIVIIATPAEAVREVLEAINPFLAEGATVTDVLSIKEPVMALAGEILSREVSFVGGHPFSYEVDFDAAPPDTRPDPDLFKGAPYCIMPLPSASGSALNTVIGLAEMLGAKPLFIDPREHDSLQAAISHLPVIAGAALWRLTTSSPAWSDMRTLAHVRFESVTGGLLGDPKEMAGEVTANRQLLIGWLDRYLLALQDLRDMLADDDQHALTKLLIDAHGDHESWASGNRSANPGEAEMHAEMRQNLYDSRPARALFGGYLSDRFFRKKDKERKQ